MTRHELLAFAERRLTAQEFRAYIDTPMTPEEREGILELVHWFERRYPTPLERLAYTRQAYARWKRTVDGA